MSMMLFMFEFEFIFFIEQLCVEIVVVVVCMIVEDGVDYGSVKCKVVKQILGNQKVCGEIMFDNEQIEEEVCIYNEFFFVDIQLVCLLYLCQVVLQLMQDLQQFNFYIIGVVWNGMVGEYLDIYLQLFFFSVKDVEIFFLNKNVNFEVGEISYFCIGQVVEILSFLLFQCGVDFELVYLVLYDEDDLCGSLCVVFGKCFECGDVVVLVVFIDVFFED